MLKKMKYKMNEIWDTVEPYAKNACEGFFIGSGVATWFYVLFFGAFGMITKQKMEINWVKK